MSNLLNIYNENFGYQVATNGIYIAVGNPNSKPYSCQEGYARVGEVLVYRKNQFDTNYSFVKKYRKDTSSNFGYINTYFTEQSSSTSLTASLITEVSGSLSFESTDRAFTTCSFLAVEDGTSTVLQNGYGRSIAMCEKYMAVGDMAFSESLGGDILSFASVDVYRIHNVGDSSDYVDEIDMNTSDFTLPTNPFCVITGSAAHQFGKSVAISNKFLLIGAPFANDESGVVYVYKQSDECGYFLHSTLTSDDVGQKYFGSAVAIDKDAHNKIAVGTLSATQSLVYVYQLSSDENSWHKLQTLQQNTSSNWLNVSDNLGAEFYPVRPQTASRYGYSVALNGSGLVVGAPNDLVYVEYSGSQTIRQRGAFYFYWQSFGSQDYKLQNKFYGDSSTFKNNMLGYSVDMTDEYILVGSPKPYFPFSSIYLSSSIDSYNTNFQDNDFGTSTYNGQALLYKWDANECAGSVSFKLATTTPIAYRKRLGECFTAFGSSVALSNQNLVIGSPAILNDDLYLQTPILAEESGSFPLNCGEVTDVLQFRMEDSICDCFGNDLNSQNQNSVIYVLDQPTVDVFGKAFIYDFADLQKNANVGNVFYNNNRLIINNTGSVLKDFFRDPLNLSNGYLYGTYDSQITLTEKQYICTIEPGEFNVSTNPTAITSSIFPYNVINKSEFDFINVDIILRYINHKLTTTHRESWWNVLVEGDVQQSMFNFFTSSIYDYTKDRLTPDIRRELATKNFDVNNDGVVDYSDAYLIWNYYIQNLQLTNYKQYVSPISRRKNYDDIISFLNLNTGKGSGNKVKDEFFDFNSNTSFDPTGSYLAPYITQVGLYANADLVAIGKLANPIKNTGEIPINIVIKWDT